MKTQISRRNGIQGKRYSGVYQQQGRMITDSDWNEMNDIVKARLEQAVADIIGSGVPQQGGLAVIADGGKYAFSAGAVYVDGIPARVDAADPTKVGPFGTPGPFDLSNQLDFPVTSLPAAAQDSVFYVDLWERPVLSIEDGDLRDIALHGADTCTRTRTMAQIKWAPKGVDPESQQVNPTRGNGLFGLALPTPPPNASKSSCDDCATDVTVISRTGNYLFRAEVHDAKYSNPSDPTSVTEVTIKWSSENGAEQYTAGNVPSDFDAESWAYEFFDAKTESQQGWHLSGFTPEREAFKMKYDRTNGAQYSRTFVRRWDGYCVLTKTGPGKWTVSDGYEKGSKLQVGTQTTAGYVDVTGPGIKVTLTNLVMTLNVPGGVGSPAPGEVFVPGDYWLALVRENETGANRVKVVGDGTPLGILHHYMRLETVTQAGAFNTPFNKVQPGDSANIEADKRKFRQGFASLAKLKADNVRYELPPEKANTIESYLRGLNGAWPDSDGDAKLSVKDILDALLTSAAAIGNQGLTVKQVNLKTGAVLKPNDSVTVEDFFKGFAIKISDKVNRYPIDNDWPILPVSIGMPAASVTSGSPISINPNALWSMIFQDVRINGSITVENDTDIVWIPGGNLFTNTGLAQNLSDIVRQMENGAVVQLALRGNLVWDAKNTTYLDGNAFPKLDDPNFAYQMPSPGDQVKGGDFELWFRLVVPYQYRKWMWADQPNPFESPNDIAIYDSAGTKMMYVADNIPSLPMAPLRSRLLAYDFSKKTWKVGASLDSEIGATAVDAKNRYLLVVSIWRYTGDRQPPEGTVMQSSSIMVYDVVNLTLLGSFPLYTGTSAPPPPPGPSQPAPEASPPHAGGGAHVSIPFGGQPSFMLMDHPELLHVGEMYRAAVGSSPTKPTLNPNQVAVDDVGNIFVASQEGLAMFSPLKNVSGKLIPGSPDPVILAPSNAQFQASGVAYDGTGTLYVSTDGALYSVTIDRNQAPKSWAWKKLSIPSPSQLLLDSGPIVHPKRLAFKNGRLFVIDHPGDNDVTWVVDPAKPEIVAWLGTPNITGNGSGQLSGATGVAIDGAGAAYVLENGPQINRRISVFGP